MGPVYFTVSIYLSGFRISENPKYFKTGRGLVLFYGIDLFIGFQSFEKQKYFWAGSEPV